MRGASIRGLGNPDTRPRGTCSVCGREFLLKVDGTVRHHGGEATRRGRRFYHDYRCKGSGRPPR